MDAPATNPAAAGPAPRSALWPCAFGLAALLLCWFTVERHGLGLSVDGVMYVSTARSLVEGHGYVQSVQEPVAAWCPLFPTLLAAIGLVGIDPLVSARWVNALAFALVIGLASDLLRRRVAARPLVWIGSALCLAGTALFQTAIFAFSEPTFTLVSLVSLLALERWLVTQSRTAFALAALAAALAWLTRYIGLVSLVAGVAILLGDRRSTLREKLPRCALFAAIAALPASVWMLRNRLVTGTWTGGRGAPTTTLFENIGQAFTGVAGWVGAERLPHPAWIGALVLGAIAALWFCARPARLPSEAALRRSFGCQATFVLSFLAGIVAASTATASVVIPGRLIAPAYVMFVLATMLALDGAIARLPTRTGRGLALAGAGLLALGWIAGQLAGPWGMLRTIHYARERGLPLTEAAWKDIRTLAWLRENPLHGEVWSNAPWAVYRFLGIPARIAPRPYRAYMPHEEDYGLDALKARVAEGGECWLVWFSITAPDWMYTLPEIRSSLTCETVADFPDGHVYRLK